MGMWNGVPYRVMLVPQSKWGIKCPYPMKGKKMTIHNTDNSASALNEAQYHNNNNNQVSYHVVVDEKEACQVVPFNRNAWASGDGGNGYGNRNTIHLEIAKNYDRNRNTTNLQAAQNKDYLAGEVNAAKIAAAIMQQEGIAPTRDNIKRHYDWNGKWCPSKILNDGRWYVFQSMVLAQCDILAGKKPQNYPVNKPVPQVVIGAKVGGTVTLATWAKQYETGQNINPAVLGKKYKIIQERAVNKSASKKSYLLAGIMSWVLEQDIVESGVKPAGLGAKPTTPQPKGIGLNSVVTLASWAKQYETGQNINPAVLGNKYKIIQIKNVSKSASKKAYLLEGIMSWVLEQDIVESGVKPAGVTTHKPKKDWSSQYIVNQPKKVMLLAADHLRGVGYVNDNQWGLPQSKIGGYFPAGTYFNISGMRYSETGRPRLLTQSGYLITANKSYVKVVQ